MGSLSTILEDLAANPSTAILDGLRDLERKTSLVFTALKSSVYNIVLQQEMQQQEMQQRQDEMGHHMEMDTEMEWDEGTMQ
ncbi:DASH complex subunit dad3 [Ceratocystis platani]|uniref:DASH complex subunit DAD3 n=1 Tax=Ceratocystis fimbriata f. sp. platani TaxID=88771 RepID=A0A0F8D3J4_CERFI|nr:DASH complex subunit dad3 [Ceratocystis platani]